MKKILTLFFITTLMLSCNDDFLDTAPRNQLSSATFWRNKDDVDKAVTGVYEAWSTAHQYHLYFADDWSDNSIAGGFWQAFYYFRWGQGNIPTGDGDIAGYWSALYSVVRKANVVLANISEPAMEEADRKRLEAEARFIRAFEYHILYNTWGEVPLVDKPLNVDELKIGRAVTGETVAFILRDLDFCIENLPVTAGELGRFTKGAAMALKARVLLYEGRGAEAAAVAKEVMDLNAYSLFTNAAGTGYRELFKTENEHNSEVIFNWEFLTPDRDSDFAFWLNPFANFLVSPTKSLVDSYDAYDPSTDQLISIDEDDEFSNRDPRLDFTVAHTGSVVNGQTLDSEAAPLNTHSTGYGTIKFYLNELPTNQRLGTNYILMRYAEVLLTYAEGKIMAGAVDQSVLDAINMVRARAYGVSYTDTGSYPEITTNDVDALTAIVRNERRVELAFEAGLRWFDIKRWKIAHGTSGVMNGPVYGARIDGVYKAAGTRAMTEKDYLRPIPQTQIDLVGIDILKQNPDY